MGQEFYLNPNTVKTECAEGISICVSKTYDITKVVNAYKGISCTEIKCAAIDNEKELVEDMNSYFVMLCTMLAEYQNSYCKLQSAVGDRILDSEELENGCRMLDIASKNIGAVVSKTVNTYTYNANLSKDVAGHRENLLKKADRAKEKCNEAMSLLNQDRDRYYEIENATKTLFLEGDNFKNYAEQILASIKNGTVDGKAYTPDKNAAWRKEYVEYSKKANAVLEVRNGEYFKSKNLKQSEIVKFTKELGCSEDVLYSYFAYAETHSDSKKNVTFLVNFVKGKYQEAFKIRVSNLNEVSKTLIQSYGYKKFSDFYDNPNSKTEKKVKDYYNAMLANRKDAKKYIMLMKSGSISYYNRLLVITADCCEQKGYDSEKTDKAIKEYYKSKEFVLFNDAILGQFYKKEKKQSVAGNVIEKSPKEYSFTDEYSVEKITSIKFGGETNDRYFDSITVGMNCRDNSDYAGYKGNITEKKTIVKKFYSSRDSKDEEKKLDDFRFEVYNGPHEVIDFALKTAKDVFVISCGVVNPWIGILAETGLSAFDSGLDAEKVMETGSKVYKEADKKFNQTGKMKKALGDTIGSFNFDFWSRIPNIDVNPKLARYGTEIGKKSAGSILTIKNVVGLLDAIKADKEFYKEKSAEMESMLMGPYISYSSDENIRNEGEKVRYCMFGAMDLPTLLVIRKLIRGEINVDKAIVDAKDEDIDSHVKKHKVYSKKDASYAKQIIKAKKEKNTAATIKSLICDKEGKFDENNFAHLLKAFALIDEIGNKDPKSTIKAIINKKKGIIETEIYGEAVEK